MHSFMKVLIVLITFYVLFLFIYLFFCEFLQFLTA